MPKPSFLVLGPGDVLEGELAPSLLGRLCVEPDQPLANYAIDKPQPFYTDPPSVTTLSNTSTVIRDVHDNLARTRLGEIFDALRTSGSQCGFAISAQTVRTFKLPQQEKVLKNMWANSQIREEIQTLIGPRYKRRKLYMVIGFKTCINATVGYLEQHDLRAKLTVSISQAVSLLSGAALPIPPWLNAMIEAGYDTSQALIQTGQLFGEVVFAIRYLEVSRRNIIARMVLANDPAIGRRPALFPGEDMVFAPGKEPEEVDGE
jgi:hypothetical protein